MTFFSSLVLWALSSLTNTESHDNPPKKPVSDVYYESIINHINFLKKKQKHKQVFYVEKPQYIKSNLPNKIDSLSIVYFTGNEVVSLLKKNKELDVIRLLPAFIQDDLIIINTIDFSVQKKGNSINFANGGGTISKFKFNCETNKYYLYNTEN